MNIKKIIAILVFFIFVFSAIAFGKSTVANITPEIFSFTGRLINHGSSLFLSDNDFRVLENFRYFDGGIGTRKGMTDYTSDSDPNNLEVVSIFPFHQENEFYLIAATASTSGITYWQIEDQAFGSTELYKTSGATSTPITHGMVRDTLCIADSTGVSVWSGTSVFPTALLIEYPSGVFTDRSDWIYDGDQHGVGSNKTIYIGYSRPFDDFQLDKDDGTWEGTASSVTENFTGGKMRYWASMTAADVISAASFVGTGVDDMTSGGNYTEDSVKSYRVEIDLVSTEEDTFKWSDDGGATWDASGVSITALSQDLNSGVTVIFGAINGHTLGDYWDFDADPDYIELPKIKTTPRPLGVHWDGLDWQYAYAAVFQKTGTSEYQDYSLFVADNSPETYMDISEMESGGTIALGFLFKPRMVRLEFPENNKNEAIVTSSIKYWNGADIVSFSNYTDGTAHGGACFTQDGNLEFDPATDWEKRIYGENDNLLYWMFITVDGTIDNYVRIFSVKAIPGYDSPNDDNYTGCLIANERLHLYNGDDPGKVLISAYRQPDVFVGSDAVSDVDNFRIGKREKFVTAVPFEGGVLWFKKSENWFMGGYNPATFQDNLVLLSNTQPCIAPKSAVVIPRPEGSFVIYQAIDGVYLINSTGINIKLSEDINAYWEIGNSKEIPASWLDDSAGRYDGVNDTYNLLIASGSGATQFNEELVFDLKRKKWTVFTRDNNVELSFMASMKDP
jgi:hypothetical protein